MRLAEVFGREEIIRLLASGVPSPRWCVNKIGLIVLHELRDEATSDKHFLR